MKSNEKYKEALYRGVAIASGSHGVNFMKVYKAMTADFGHRKKQTVTVKGIFTNMKKE